MDKKHLLAIIDWTKNDVERVMSLSKDVKANRLAHVDKLRGQSLAMIFQKPSTRTRISFQVGIFELGGQGLYLSSNDLQLGRGESIPDTAQVLGRYNHGIMARVFKHETVTGLAEYAGIPVINGLSDLLHPCQGLTDYFTILENKGRLAGVKVTYVGDGNNVAHSLIYGAARTGAHLTIACPKGYEPRADIVERGIAEGKETGAKIAVVNDPVEGVTGADVVYTDVWTSMGQESEKEKRLAELAPYQINEKLFSNAKDDAIFMHCLPAHRGEEVTDGVADHARSVIFDQAENRLHVQKAIMLMLMG